MSSFRPSAHWRFAFGLVLLTALPTIAPGQDDSTGPLGSPAQDHGTPAIVEIRPSAASEGFLAEPGLIGRSIEFATRTLGDTRRLNNGVYPEFSNMTTGAGWISAGPGYRHWLFADRALVEASAAISWRSYKMAQSRFEFTHLARSRLAVGSQVRWQDLTQVTTFGSGADSLDDNRSEYRLKSTDVVGYTTVRPVRWLFIDGRIGWLQRPTLLAPAGSFQRGNPETQIVFADDPVYALPEQPNYLHSEAALTADTRNSRSHPTSGGVYRAVWTTYADRDAASFSFRRYEAEATQFVPLAGRRVVFALHGWLVGSQTDAHQLVPFYLMPSLGGHNTLRSYTDFRFHDRHLLVMNAESRFALLTHADLAVFVDAGNVAARVSDLNLDKTSYGVGIRMHSQDATFARLDLARVVDGWRLLFRLSDPFNSTRLSRATAAVPFVP